jgi:ABC-2 type transport system permease protein
MLVFARRCAKEIVIDPLSVSMGLGFPIVLLLLLTAINRNIPVNLFDLEQLTPGITVFGFSFITLFSALLLAKDRTTSFLQRLFTTPLTAVDYILGYTLPMLPISLMQAVICYFTAVILGLPLSVNILWAILISMVTSLLYIAMGLLFGSILNEKQVGGLCGTLVTNLTAWLSGIWFDLSLVGGWFKTIADLLPFSHAVEMHRAVLSGSFDGIFPHLWWVLGYTLAVGVTAVIAFTSKMKEK